MGAWSAAGCLEHGRAPFALDGQDRWHWSNVGLRRWRHDRADVLGLRRLAHEKIVDQPLRAVSLTAQRESAGHRRCRIEVPEGPFHSAAELRPPHFPAAIDAFALISLSPFL